MRADVQHRAVQPGVDRDSPEDDGHGGRVHRGNGSGVAGQDGRQRLPVRCGWLPRSGCALAVLAVVMGSSWVEAASLCRAVQAR